MPQQRVLVQRPPVRRRRRIAGLRPALAIVIALLAALALASSAAALEQQIGVAGNDAFGFSVAVQGDTLVIGTLAPAGEPGAAYVYQRTGDTWNQTAKLTPSDSAPGDNFGKAVAIDGDTIAVGAPDATIGVNAAQGAVYTFTRTGTPDRAETAKLTVSDGFAHDQLGTSVAINGDTIVAGAPAVTVAKNANQGAIYTFTRDGADSRTETAKLTASDGATDTQLGQSVAIDGDTVVAGAPGAVGAKTTPGSAYTFARTGAPARTQTAKLTSSQGVAGDQFGQSVGIDGDTIVAGAPRAFFGGIQKGAAFTFTRTGESARTETGSLSASDGGTTALLGQAVAIDPGMILAGAPLDTIGQNTFQGSAYTFSRTGLPARRQTSKLSDPDGAANDLFGLSLALDGSTIAVGAPGRGLVSVFFSPAPSQPLPPLPALLPPSTKPVLSRLEVKPTTIRIAPRRSARRPSNAITFVLSTGSTVRLTVANALPGRMVGNRCDKPTRANHRHRHCTRIVTVRQFAVSGKAGTNAIPVTASILGRAPLPVGHYRLIATPTTPSGTNGAAHTTTFTIIK